MAEFERELREGLRRVEAPAGFGDRVMARLEARERGLRRSAWWRSVAAVLVLGVAVGGWRLERARTEARETREQFAVAMRVTSRVTGRSFAEAGRRLERTDAGLTRGEEMR